MVIKKTYKKQLGGSSALAAARRGVSQARSSIRHLATNEGQKELLKGAQKSFKRVKGKAITTFEKDFTEYVTKKGIEMVEDMFSGKPGNNVSIYNNGNRGNRGNRGNNFRHSNVSNGRRSRNNRGRNGKSGNRVRTKHSLHPLHPLQFTNQNEIENEKEKENYPIPRKEAAKLFNSARKNR